MLFNKSTTYYTEQHIAKPFYQPVFLMECPYYIGSAKSKWAEGKSAKLPIEHCTLLHTEEQNIVNI